MCDSRCPICIDDSTLAIDHTLMLRQYGQQGDDGRWHSPPAERNKKPISDVLQRILPKRGLVLEIASGTGQHVIHFAKTFPRLNWQPTEPDIEMFQTIERNLAETSLPNISSPFQMNAAQDTWPVDHADAILAINLLHVSPWPTITEALFRGAETLHSFRGPLFIYGAFIVGGDTPTESNLQFDKDLRATNPDWGLRDLEKVQVIAEQHGFSCDDVIEMPANNLGVVFAKRE